MRFNIILTSLVVLFSVHNAICQESAPALKDNTFVMTTIKSENDYLGKWLRQAYTEVFRRMGLKVEFKQYPAKRASMEAEAGNVDGELGRPYDYLSEHTNLIRVEESLFPLTFSAFTVQIPIPELNGWESLKGTNYRVGYIRGVRTTESNLPNVIGKENLSDVTEPAQGLKQLISGRIDLFVDEESGILTLLNSPEFKDSKIRSAGIMGSVHLYPYLHKKHADLAPKMAEVIKAVKAEGLVEQYRVAVEKEFGIVRK